MRRIKNKIGVSIQHGKLLTFFPQFLANLIYEIIIRIIRKQWFISFFTVIKYCIFVLNDGYIKVNVIKKELLVIIN